ncbi:hypothetical protein PENSUB_9178 [Penicillium subrubescens]|uniref:Uncharacterized protein n=1 Tax=Penicillium subrubescens TaxID=1316194 RepID=A0A1Q5TE55_9EURO|nr:hypothetical protein PENSUB_9178 [Penicillium subrubescens]
MDTSTSTQQGLGPDLKQHRHSKLQGIHALFASEYPGYEISYPHDAWMHGYGEYRHHLPTQNLQQC